MALTIDKLRISADSTAADELELSLFNAILGRKHPMAGTGLTTRRWAHSDRKYSATSRPFWAIGCPPITISLGNRATVFRRSRNSSIRNLVVAP